MGRISKSFPVYLYGSFPGCVTEIFVFERRETTRMTPGRLFAYIVLGRRSARRIAGGRSVRPPRWS
jgi:hypothetical protein